VKALRDTAQERVFKAGAALVQLRDSDLFKGAFNSAHSQLSAASAMLDFDRPADAEALRAIIKADDELRAVETSLAAAVRAIIKANVACLDEKLKGVL
jgi:multidrug efflux pump subunit AcrA (membrane-fusion protein)